MLPQKYFLGRDDDILVHCFHKIMTFYVTYNEEECDVHCSCQKYAFRGIQCKHALSVLCYNNVRKLPDKYILRWWRKDVIRAHTKIKVGFSCWTNDVETKRYHDLCTKFGELADWVVGDETEYRDTDNWLDCKKKEVQLTIIKANDSQKLKAKQVVQNEDEMVDEDDDPTITVHDPLRKKIKKGRPRKIANQPPKRRRKKMVIYK
ncbi:hypothetical protein MKX03_002021 [Papaver bracteatum]|nr:hypothetical protein MKX03_002021 [Papaver bracteatum]